MITGILTWAKVLFTDNSQDCYLAGWSTGVIIAAALARIIKPKALILLSPTHSFCRHESLFFHGTRPSVLRAMINDSGCQKETVLQKFFLRCGIDSYQSTQNYSVNVLHYGLFFLLQANPSDVSPLECPVVCLHGKNDKIIPVEAGKVVCNALDGILYELEGAHVFYQKSATKIKTIIEDIVR